MDGVSNFMEYAMGMSPTSASTAGLPVATAIPLEHLNITFSRRQPSDLTYIIENPFLPSPGNIVAQLLPGASAWTGTAAVTESGSGATRTVTVSDPDIVGTVRQEFLRLRVVGPQ